MKFAEPKLNKFEKELLIPAGQKNLPAILGLPPKAKALIIFAHGSGSSRFSQRNMYVARELQKSGLATLLMDLLTPTEEEDRGNVFDIYLLAERLGAARDWAQSQPSLHSLMIGYFGASTGAAAALWASAENQKKIFAIVSRGGRPDLAIEKVGKIQSPTLLIVGSNDPMILKLNRSFFAKLQCPKKIEIIPNATHLFEEAGTLEQVARIAVQWFHSQIGPARKIKWMEMDKSPSRFPEADG